MVWLGLGIGTSAVGFFFPLFACACCSFLAVVRGRGARRARTHARQRRLLGLPLSPGGRFAPPRGGRLQPRRRARACCAVAAGVAEGVCRAPPSAAPWRPHGVVAAGAHPPEAHQTPRSGGGARRVRPDGGEGDEAFGKGFFSYPPQRRALARRCAPRRPSRGGGRAALAPRGGPAWRAKPAGAQLSCSSLSALLAALLVYTCGASCQCEAAVKASPRPVDALRGA